MSTLEIKFSPFPCFAVFVFILFWLAFLKMIYCCRLSPWWGSARGVNLGFSWLFSEPVTFPGHMQWLPNFPHVCMQLLLNILVFNVGFLKGEKKEEVWKKDTSCLNSLEIASDEEGGACNSGWVGGSAK